MDHDYPYPEWGPGTFLAQLGPELVAELLALGVRRRFEAGHVLIREGDRGTHVELLLLGFVKVTTLAGDADTLLSVRMPGDVLGETAVLTGAPRNATVTTCGRVISVVLAGPVFEGFLRRRPDAMRLVTASVVGQLQFANRRRTDFGAYPAHIRLARVLIEIADGCGRPRPDGSVEIGVTLSQPELATMIGIAQATVQKAMQELRGKGLIETGYRRLVVCDLPALRAMTNV
ncbi:CRP-like cAMP-binding protein [Catenuloplanes nepalensis]|uniref:CRP-like cAMP-binding protein n=1 Tax=Catenuloplanes nepalensis TaxID=587533 RepID=A0ABT9MYA6_9ACTN|nr:Crp/Fnr family transcriptional regulator [Catenuloplanes nepalensis]MDP9796412.1 CRP-like cAMP-binding protein [Catenuloplanes nepalensis]